MSHPFLAIPAFLYIYQGTDADRVMTDEIARYLRSLVHAAVAVRPDIVHYALSSCSDGERERIVSETALSLARLRVRDPAKRNLSIDPLKPEIDYERGNLLKAGGRTCGIIYEGFELQRLYGNFIVPRERNLDHLHLIITNQLFATWDSSNHRYHARVSIYGLPALISTTGLVEAPARPGEFYVRKHLGADLHELREQFRASCMDYQDPRMAGVLKGYAAQALFHYLVGYPFCEDCNCRLFNAHRQSELLQAQSLSPYEFCPRHQAVLERLREYQVLREQVVPGPSGQQSLPCSGGLSAEEHIR